MSKKIVVTLPDETYKLMKNLEGMENKDGKWIKINDKNFWRKDW